jgi:hypothetical protein
MKNRWLPFFLAKAGTIFYDFASIKLRKGKNRSR